jgi:hypothetical protein
MGVFVVKRRTGACGLRGSLKELGIQARRRMHTPVVLPYQWLCSVLRGHYATWGSGSIRAEMYGSGFHAMSSSDLVG